MKNIKQTQIALSDVDGTIVKGSLVLGHAVTLHNKKVINLGTLPKDWVANPKDEKLIRELAEAYRENIKGKTPEELEVDLYVTELVKNESNFYSVLSRLKNIKNSGAKVVLISGSPSFLVDRLGKHYGFESVGSNYSIDDSGRFTGEIDRVMFSGEAKREFIDTINIEDYENVFAFGDTESDEPLFERANYSVLVEPNDYTMASLGNKVNEIVHD